MSTDRDTTRIVRSWLRTDEHESADRVLGTVLDRLDTTPQRRATWWPARRTPTMNRFLTIGLGAAAVVVLLFLGSRLLGSPSGLGGPGAEPTPTPQASVAEPSVPPSVEPSPTPVGLLPEGSHVLSDAGVAMTVDIPGPDWYGEPFKGILIKNDNADAPDGAGMIVFTEGLYYVYADPCRWSTTTPDAPATTVDEVVSALSAQASRDASAPVDVTVDGYEGKSITLHVPDDAVFSECDQDFFGSWGVESESTPARYSQDPGQIDELWILDVDGVLVVIDTAYYEGTPAEDVAEMRAIVDSITFEAP